MTCHHVWCVMLSIIHQIFIHTLTVSQFNKSKNDFLNLQFKTTSQRIINICCLWLFFFQIVKWELSDKLPPSAFPTELQLMFPVMDFMVCVQTRAWIIKRAHTCFPPCPHPLITAPLVPLLPKPPQFFLDWPLLSPRPPLSLHLASYYGCEKRDTLMHKKDVWHWSIIVLS